LGRGCDCRSIEVGSDNLPWPTLLTSISLLPNALLVACLEVSDETAWTLEYLEEKGLIYLLMRVRKRIDSAVREVRAGSEVEVSELK
jgi:hypothetical protein